MAAAALVDAPNIDWTEDDGLYRRVELFRRDVEDMMLGPLTTYKELSKTRTLMHWLKENIKELVEKAGKDTENDYRKVTEFLLDWAKPKTTVYNDFKTLRTLNQGSMSFEQCVAKVKKLVNNCEIENAEAKESTILKFHSNWCKLPNGMHGQCVQVGHGAKLDRILDIYRNEAAVQAHFSSRHNSQPSVHQVSADSNSPKEEGEEDIYKLHDKRRYNQNTRPSSPEN